MISGFFAGWGMSRIRHQVAWWIIGSHAWLEMCLFFPAFLNGKLPAVSDWFKMSMSDLYWDFRHTCFKMHKPYGTYAIFKHVAAYLKQLFMHPIPSSRSFKSFRSLKSFKSFRSLKKKVLEVLEVLKVLKVLEFAPEPYWAQGFALKFSALLNI